MVVEEAVVQAEETKGDAVLEGAMGRVPDRGITP